MGFFHRSCLRTWKTMRTKRETDAAKTTNRLDLLAHKPSRGPTKCASRPIVSSDDRVWSHNMKVGKNRNSIFLVCGRRDGFAALGIASFRYQILFFRECGSCIMTARDAEEL